MSFHALALITMLSGFTLPGTVPGQKPDDSSRSGPVKVDANPSAPVLVSLAELERADVLLESSSTEQPGNERGPGRAAATRGADVPKGKVTDLVLFSEDGQIACAALSVGKILESDERVVLVPTTALKITAIEDRPAYLLKLAKSEVRALPPFDIKKEVADGLDRAVERARGLSGGAGGSDKSGGERGKGGEGPAHGGTAAKEASPDAAIPAYFLSSQLIDCSVNGSDAEFGRVHDGVVDLGSNAVGYLIVSRNGGASAGVTMHVIPLSACRWTLVAGRSFLKVEKRAEELNGAPEYKKPERGILSPEQMKSADAFFGGRSG